MEKHAAMQTTLTISRSISHAWEQAHARLLHGGSTQEKERIIYEQRALEKQFENLLNACRFR